jgi:phage-related protein
VPIVADAMNQIATSTNLVVKGFLNWAKSTPGLVALRKVTSSAADAFADVAPHVLSLATALGEMLGRISGVSLAAGSKGLVGVLDAVTAKLKTITAKSVQDGLDVLRKTFESVRSAVVKVGEVIGIAIGIYRKYQAEIMVISDVLAILAIVFGGPVTAIIAAVGLIVRHLETVKAAVAQVREVFAKPGPVAFIDNLRTVVSTVWPVIVDAFNQIKAAVLPTLLQITDKIRKDLIPAIGEFLAAAAPVVAFFIERFAPIISAALQTVVKLISAAVTIITGIFKVLTGILTGDWSKTWAGIKQILSGALSAIKALISGAFSVIRGYFSGITSAIGGIWRGLWALVKDTVSTAIGNVKGLVAGLAVSLRNALSIDLSAAGRKIISSLIAGIRAKAGEVVNVVSGIAQSVRDHFPFSPAKRGPLKRKPMFTAGRNITRDLARGMTSRAGDAKLAAQLVAGRISNVDRVNLTGTPTLFRPQGNPITINFGVVGDPVAAGREVEKIINRYRGSNGRAGLA